MRDRYYLITGLDEGQEIVPYAIDTHKDDLDFHLDCGSYDKARYYEPISKQRYQEEIEKEQERNEREYQKMMEEVNNGK